jgi:hypothetical protein
MPNSFLDQINTYIFPCKKLIIFGATTFAFVETLPKKKIILVSFYLFAVIETYVNGNKKL